MLGGRRMAVQSVDLRCPGCGEPWTLDMTECPSCHRPVVVTTFNSVYNMIGPEVSKYAKTYKKALDAGADDPKINSAVGFCYLRLGLYDKALSAFEAAIEDDFDESETYFYAAVCLLGGKKAFLASRATIDRVQEYINAALMLERKGIYLVFLAYIKYDFFERKYLNTTPDYRACLSEAASAGVSGADITMLFDTLRVPNPFC